MTIQIQKSIEWVPPSRWMGAARMVRQPIEDQDKPREKKRREKMSIFNYHLAQPIPLNLLPIEQLNSSITS